MSEKKFKLVITPAVPPKTRLQIEQALETEGYEIMGSGQYANEYSCDISFYLPAPAPVPATKTFVTFGFDHIHRINGIIFDHNCVAVVDGGRKMVFELFGDKFCFEYSEDRWDEQKIKYFPRGYIRVRGRDEAQNQG